MKSKIELEKIKNDCLALLTYLSKKGGKEVVNGFEQVVDSCYKNNDSKGLQMVLNDLSEWVSGLYSNDEKDIKSILGKIDKEKKDVVNKILEKELIENDKEYETLLEFVNQNFGDPREKKRLESANKILLRYSQE
jgi:hypothetical protein